MRIVHIFRAPIGGLFRHVIDLAKEQAARGHDVGVFCDATFAGERNEKLLAELATHLSLGVERIEMHRNPKWTDLAAVSRIGDYVSRTGAEVMHGHGSKGGLYARLSAVYGARGPIRAYTPHGGSLNYKPGSLIHRAYMGVERMLERGTDAFLFESQFVADRFKEYVCPPHGLSRIVLNGLYAHEVQPVTPNADAADFLYIGEFRFAKGIDNLLAAMARLKAQRSRTPTLVLVGQGPDEPELREQAAALGIAEALTFRKPMAAREAFALARTMIVPSRFESMPYVVIEAAGATLPMISTDVGGIPEIFGAEKRRLIPCDNIDALTLSMSMALDGDRGEHLAAAERLTDHIRANFSVEQMATTVLDTYIDAMKARPGAWSINAIARTG